MARSGFESVCLDFQLSAARFSHCFQASVDVFLSA